MGIDFIETSAKASVNVEKAFLLMASQIKARFKTQPAGSGTSNVALKGGIAVNAQQKSGGCCSVY